MSENELFRTGRMASMRGMTPAYMPGATVYLQRDLQEFPKGSPARVISVQSTRPGEHRYQLTIGEQKMWAFETDIRPTPPGEPSATLGNTDRQKALGPTQRMSTMTLSQRLAALGPNATQRMHVLTQEERLKKLVQTNRLRTLGAAAEPVADPAAPDSSDPTTTPNPAKP
jgi:hypothetical protein